MPRLPKNQYPDRRMHRVSESETGILALRNHSWKRESTVHQKMMEAQRRSPMMTWQVVKLQSTDEYSYIGTFRKADQPCKPS